MYGRMKGRKYSRFTRSPVLASTSLEQRVVQLEKQVAKLRDELSLAGSKNGKDWRRTIGMFTDDPGMKAIFEKARKLREADRRKSRASSRSAGKPKR